MHFKLTISSLFLVFTLITKLAGNSGDGTPFISNIKYKGNQQNFVWSIEQTFQGTMLLAGKTGLLEFDSENWSLIEIPDAALALKASEYNSKIYVGGRNFIGYLSPNKQGILTYYSLLPDTAIKGNYKEIIETETSIFFYSTHSVICIFKATNILRKAWTTNENSYLGIFKTGSTVYLNIANLGLHEIQNTKLVRIKSDKILNKTILFSANYAKNISLVGTDNGDLYLFNRKIFTPYNIDNKEFIRSGVLSDGVLIDASTLALSTTNFGVLIVDKNTGKTRNIINYDSGLPNEFIMDLFVDKQNGLWMAHSLGLSRIDTKLPMTNFSSYPGLSSNVVTVNYWNNKLYAATSNGIFTLDSIKLYTSKEILKLRPVKSSSTIVNKEAEVDIINNINPAEESYLPKSEIEIKTETANNSQTTEKKNSYGFFKKLFSKNESEDIEVIKPKTQIISNNEEIVEPIKIKQPEQKYEYLKYNQNILKSKDYGFVQLPLIKKRCKLLIPFGKQLLAITDATLYSINMKNEVKEIFNTNHIYTVIKSKYNSNLLYIITENGIYQGIFSSSTWQFRLSIESKGNDHTTDAIELDNNILLVANDDEVKVYSLENNITSVINVTNAYSERVTFKNVNDKKYLIIGNIIYSINFKNIKDISFNKMQDANLVKPFLAQEDNLWIRTEDNMFRYFGKVHMPDKIFSFLKVFDNIIDIQIDNKGNLWVVDEFNAIYRLKISDFEKYKLDVKILIKDIKTPSGKYLPRQNVKLKYSENALTFEIVSPSYLKFNSNQYQYTIEGLMNNWSEWNSENIISVPYLPPGNYTFMVRTKNLFGEISEIESFSFKIVPPFWRTIYFYVICALLLFLSFQLRQKYKLRKHTHEKEILKQKVKERTVELELKNKSITDSIIYAERIQRGMLPANDIISSCLKEYFVLFKPRNIVSGDFYWMTQKEDITYIVAADCTGHGVPGAFMSMLGIAYLNEVVRSSTSNITAAGILEKLRERISKLFSQETFKTNDGIDIALLIIDSPNKQIQYAGAYSPLYQITTEKNSGIDKGKIEGMHNENILLVYKADRFHVGKPGRNFKKFTNHIIPYHKDDTFYIFSDGFVDQFGGKEESKFKYGPFKNLILEISDKPMENQKETLFNRFNEWKGKGEQTDDILIWGLKPN